jgi:hypothetical protein
LPASAAAGAADEALLLVDASLSESSVEEASLELSSSRVCAAAPPIRLAAAPPLAPPKAPNHQPSATAPPAGPCAALSC